MHVHHLAIWVKDLETMKAFYETYFEGKASERYHNPRKNFYSYFLSFDGGAKLELMHQAEVPDKQHSGGSQHLGLIHFALDPGSKEAVNALTETLRQDGHRIVGEPRQTGDGYWESVILDPEDNIMELCHDVSPDRN